MVCIAGKPNRDILLWKLLSGEKNFMIFVPWNDDWNGIIAECYGNRAKKVVRYAIKKERNIFNREQLENVVLSLSSEYRVSVIDEDLFNRCMALEWYRDGVANYPDYDLYRRHGQGVVIVKGEEIVASCSSYSGFNDEIEIEIDTKADYRRQGLAYVCAANPILECLDKDWPPSRNVRPQL
ncbi:MAG: GNAT family N-acetyltransferase [Lachnospiraceae bacterium]|nr:GNAT family N-acetyltransferase [Lachnospiraceae bacterium]